ncbi:MAG: DUF4390 domain-containing protein [Gemmatimonadaceae bacterium]
MRSRHVLSDSRTRDLLHHGFPARLHYRLELWSTSGWFDNQVGKAEWDVIVRFTPLDKRYAVLRIENDRVSQLGPFERFDEAVAAVERPFRPEIRAPARRDKQYYRLVLDVAMLTVNDLDEVERWLRGEFRPAVRGQRNPGTAITRGVRSLVVGLLGSQNQEYQMRTRTFVP